MNSQWLQTILVNEILVPTHFNGHTVTTSNIFPSYYILRFYAQSKETIGEHSDQRTSYKICVEYYGMYRMCANICPTER
jgi:hypothetical protein